MYPSAGRLDDSDHMSSTDGWVDARLPSDELPSPLGSGHVYVAIAPLRWPKDCMHRQVLLAYARDDAGGAGSVCGLWSFCFADER